jgi:8-oxo-dGTP pyrophosphatase MutT (NUDIX family)
MTRIETLLIVKKDSKMLLGYKHPEKKFGGKWNGFGGGLKEGETLEECIIRETKKETGITPRNITKLGKIIFHFLTDEQDHEVHFYQATDYEGKLDTSKDFTEYREFSPDELEAINMIPADRYWLSFFVEGKKFKGGITFGVSTGDFYVVSYKINKVDSLN